MTIYALSTGQGISGIAVIRVSGKKTEDVMLMKPTTGMNNSGLALKHFVKLFNINLNNLYVCVDDENIQLPSFIKAVPTIYLVSQKKIVVDDSIPKWIEEKLSTSESQSSGELQAYFGQCDSSFGSSFSFKITSLNILVAGTSAVGIR